MNAHTEPTEHDPIAEAKRAGIKEGAARTLSQTFCLVAGLALVAVGVLGFFFAGTSFDTGGVVSGEEFLGLELNGWHNVVHLATGAFLLLMAATATTAITGALAFGIVYAVVAVWGFTAENDILGLVPIETVDNIVHAALAGAALFVAISAGALKTSAGRDSKHLDRAHRGDPAQG